MTRWAEDPFALGSYSYLAVGSSPADRDALAEPIDDRLLFAGEATSSGGFPGTVHGALRSGVREAERVGGLGIDGPVVVVGAGVAGLAAAAAIAGTGLEVTVVEARDRIGGRVWTDRSLGVPLDLGASWIHGIDGNPVSELADGLGLERVVTDYDNAVRYGPDGAELDEDDVGDLDDIADEVFGAARELRADASFADAVDRLAAEEALDGSERLALDYVVASEVEHELAADAEELSAGAYEEGAEYDGDDVVFPGGYAAVLDGLADDIDLRLGEQVRSIEWDDAVTVHTDTGTHGGAAAVVTLPLGVLKSGSVRFDPPLPSSKVDAIDRLGMGLLDKLYLRFPHVFWDEDIDVVGYIPPEAGRWVEWINLAPVVGEPILCGFNAGSVARRLEALEDEAVVGEAMATLRTIYG